MGNKDKNLDNLKLPKFLSIFHDTVVASATLMLVFFGTILFILGPDILSNAKVITSGTLYVPENNHSYVRYSNGIHVLCLLIYVNARCKNVRWRINKCIPRYF